MGQEVILLCNFFLFPIPMTATLCNKPTYDASINVIVTSVRNLNSNISID